MRKIWVRILPSKNSEVFFRCGMQFTPQWQACEVDAATKSALQAEQMLDVVTENPTITSVTTDEAALEITVVTEI